jgi:hypothetical protein
MGDKSCLSLFGTQPEMHRWLPEHLTSEYPRDHDGKRPNGRGVEAAAGSSGQSWIRLPGGLLGPRFNAGNSAGDGDEQEVSGRMTLARMVEIANRPTPQELKDLSARKQVTIPEWMKRK